MDILKLAFIFVTIVLGLRQGISVGLTLFLAGIVTAIIYSVPLAVVTNEYAQLIASWRFIELTAVIILITMLGNLLSGLGRLKRLSMVCRDIYGGRRTATVIIPPLVGFMPMPGGALMSAPLVNSALDGSDLEPHYRCASNYWFRHVVEHFMPIYPGMIVSQAITGVEVGRLALMQAPLSVIMLAAGIYFYARRIESEKGIALFRPLLEIITIIWPIFLAVFLYAVVRLNLPLAVLVSLVLVAAVYRPKTSLLWKSIKKGLSPKLLFLIFGILSFQTILEVSGGVGEIQRLTIDYGFPEALIIVVVSFTAGILTGMFAAFVALGYSLLSGFLYQPDVNMANILLAFLSGFIGMMLSPAHLCLILTNEYFGSNLLKVYKSLLAPLLVLAVGGWLLYISPWPTWF